MMKEFKNHTFVICAYKESDYLEEVIVSLENQTVKSNIIIATSTPNEYIQKIADKHHLELFVNHVTEGIGPDWNFAVQATKTQFVTVAHQDDVYDMHYTEEMYRAIQRYPDSIMLFTNHKEIREGKVVPKNINLKIKAIMVLPIRLVNSMRFTKKLIVSFGNPICCPSVCLNTEKTGKKPFREDMKSNIDWGTWLDFSKKKGRFIYVSRILTFHRVHHQSETSKLIEDHERVKEDYEMFCRIWPKWLAKCIMIFYKHAQDAN